MKNHASIDARSLAFGRAISQRLREDPSLVLRAQATLSRWLATCSPNLRPTLLEWNTILEGPLRGVLNVLTDTSERATRLRQSNPFAGVLSQQERTDILREFETYEAVSALMSWGR